VRGEAQKGVRVFSNDFSKEKNKKSVQKKNCL